MKEEIKGLRVKIDGLAQLVKHLTAAPLVVNLSSLPEGVDIDTIIENWEKYKVILAPIQPDYSYVERINSTELNKAYDSLILAKAWLGKVLGELGDNTPYANDGLRKLIGDIEPAADKPGLTNESTILWLHKDFIQGEWYNKNHIEKVDWLREEIKNLVQDLDKIEITLNDPNELRQLKSFIIKTNSIKNVYNHLCEARFWLGFELQRIRENESKHS